MMSKNKTRLKQISIPEKNRKAAMELAKACQVVFKDYNNNPQSKIDCSRIPSFAEAFLLAAEKCEDLDSKIRNKKIAIVDYKGIEGALDGDKVKAKALFDKLTEIGVRL